MNTGHVSLDAPEAIFDDDRDLTDEIAVLMATYTGWAGFEDYCRDGGTVHNVEATVTLDEYGKNSAQITGSFEVSFDERYHLGCRDISWSNSFKGGGTLVIDTSTGEIALEIFARHVPGAADIEDEEERWLAEGEALEAQHEMKRSEEI